MAQPERLLARVDIGERALGEEAEHRLVDARQQPVLERDGDQAADHRLGGRVDPVLHPGGERRVVGFGDDAAVAHDQHAVHAVGDPEFDKTGQLARAHALGFC
jgi:hypothetical protein